MRRSSSDWPAAALHSDDAAWIAEGLAPVGRPHVAHGAGADSWCPPAGAMRALTQRCRGFVFRLERCLTGVRTSNLKNRQLPPAAKNEAYRTREYLTEAEISSCSRRPASTSWYVCRALWHF